MHFRDRSLYPNANTSQIKLKYAILFTKNQISEMILVEVLIWLKSRKNYHVSERNTYCLQVKKKHIAFNDM